MNVFDGYTSELGERQKKKEEIMKERKKKTENNCLRLTTMNGKANREKYDFIVEMQCGRLNEKQPKAESIK